MSEPVRPTFTPTVFYRDPRAALDWLSAAFGFEISLLVTDDSGAVGHAEMSFDGATIGVGGEWSGAQLGPARMLSPASLDGAGTQFIWVTLRQGLDEHRTRAEAAGARVTEAPADQFYGDRTYRALDPEGHVWCFRQTARTVSVAEMERATGLKISDGTV